MLIGLNVKEETVNVKLAKSDEIQGFQIENKETKTQPLLHIQDMYEFV